MQAHHGHRPVPRLFGRRWLSARCVMRSAVVALLTWAHSTAAAGPQLLTLPEAETLALSGDPMQTALVARAEALDADAVVAGALPDPTLRIGLNNYPLESGDFSSEAMTNAGMSYRQAFPGGRTREYRGTVLDWQGRAIRREASLQAEEVRLAVRERWLDVYYGERSLELIAESRAFFENLAEITESLYSVGRKRQQDVLRADLEVSRLEDRLLDLETRVVTARGELSEWIGDAAYRPLPEEHPQLPVIPDLEALQNRLGTHARLALAAARVEAARAGVLLADERSQPGWALDVGYGYRDGTQPSGASRSDLVTVGLTFEIPFFSRKSVDSTLTSALASRSAAEAQLEQARRALSAELAVEYARWEQLGQRLGLFESRIREQSAAHSEAALLAYRSDAADFADVMRAYIDALETRLQIERLGMDKAQSQARLAYLGGLAQ